MSVSKLDPWDPYSVASWALKRVDEAMGGSKWLWVRVIPEGPGYMLTDKDEPPRGSSGWTRVAKIDWDEASSVARGAPTEWSTRSRLAERIAAALPGRK